MSCDNPNFVALDWLIGITTETLTQVRQQLEAFVSAASEEPAVATAKASLHECLELIHQVHGSLRLANLTGAAILAEEIEQSLRAVVSEQFETNDETYEFLIRALLELPLYLEKMAFQRRDHIVVLLPLLNDLRAVRRAPLITENLFFFPDLSALQQVSGNRHPFAADSIQLKNLVSKLRKIYHAAAAGLISGTNNDESLSYLKKVGEKMSLLYQGSTRQHMWEILLGLFEGIADRRLQVLPALRYLLRRMDVEFRLLQGQGARALDAHPDNKFIGSLLFYLYLCGPNGPRAKTLYYKFALDNAVAGAPRPDTEILLAMGPGALGKAVTALREELQTIRESLDPNIASGKQPALPEIITAIKRLADTLGILSLKEHCVKAHSICTLLHEASANKQADDGLMLAAATLEELDAELAVITTVDQTTDKNSALINSATELILCEAGINLGVVKESIEEYIADHWDTRCLNQVSSRLQEACGALNLAGYQGVGKLLADCNNFIQAQLIDAGIEPQSQQLDHLADAITSAEFYLERCAARIENVDELLTLAQNSVAAMVTPSSPEKAIEGISPLPDFDTTVISDRTQIQQAFTVEPLPCDQADAVKTADSNDDLIQFNTSQALSIVGYQSLPEAASPPKQPASEQALTSVSEDAATLPPASQIDSDSHQRSDTRDEYGQLWEVFAQEAEIHLAVVADYLAKMRLLAPIFDIPSDALHRALHTLKGSATMAEVTPVAEVVAPLEHFVKELRSYKVAITEDIYVLIEDAVNAVRAMLVQIHAYQPLQFDQHQPFTTRVTELQRRVLDPLTHDQKAGASLTADPQLLAIIMTDGMKELLEADQMLNTWRAAPNQLPQLQPLYKELDLLQQAAGRAQLTALQQLAQLLLKVYQQVIDGHLEAEPALWATLEQGHNELLDLIDAVAASQDLPQVSTAVKEALSALADSENYEADSVFRESSLDDKAPEQVLSAFADDIFLDASDTTVLTESERALDLVSASDVPAAAENTVHSPELSVTAADKTKDGIEASALLKHIDADVVEIFVAEATELSEELERLLQQWEQEPTKASYAESLKRILHTFKGGARMAGLMGLGEIAHRFETAIEQVQSNDEPGAAFFSDGHKTYDRIAADTAIARAWLDGKQENAFCQLLDNAWADNWMSSEATTENFETTQGNHPVTDPAADAAIVTKSDEAEKLLHERLPTSTTTETNGTPEQPLVVDNFGREEADSTVNRSQSQEMVRVPSELLEKLVNLAGETSISRSRLEEQIGEFGTALEEVDSTLLRLNEQLRRLDKATEAQILFRREQLAEQDSTFDPLEMDRYSAIQQLSRSLLESTSDLLELHSTLDNKVRDTETLLLQQSRVNTELQEGLMRSRMVPFSRLVPRLRRIVRQISSELDKQVELIFANVEGELDRSMLERIVVPLEHMLRNALDHGIETPSLRLACDKPERGRITLSLIREGGEVVLSIADDGSGIDLARMRNVAVANGLISADTEISTDDMLQFILQPGFTTAEQVTQISGRGVGMDVVSAEIKQMGGTLSINSEAGKGTKFVIRLPFTVSVNRALMVRVGSDLYALPLNTIEGIVRISRFELEHYYASEKSQFEYVGEHYEVHYFGTLLQSRAQPKLNAGDMQFPVLLVRTENSAMALQVDAILGSREIVVKNLGPQFAAVQGIAGATVTGDGSVVIILDMHALLRKQSVLQAQLRQELVIKPEEKSVKAQKLVMVVDDSVTVRKVTSRLLEREGYAVATAKDGKDAVLQLQDSLPDIILLDIEMPRMDGFEVAQYILSSSRLRHIPIIMITSRSGKKHRDYALLLGVNHYLGKPYQEEVLLSAVRKYINEPALEH